MSLVTQLTTAFTRVGTEFKTLRGTLGPNANLTTTAKDTLVNAINEVNAKTASAGAAIDDSTARTSTVYSSTKTVSVVNAAVAALINGAPSTYDTFKEVADYIASDTSGAAAMTASINNKVDYAAAQTLTTAQQNQALANINGISVTSVGDVTRDFSGDFTAALV